MLFLNHKGKSEMGLVKLEATKKINRMNEMLSLEFFSSFFKVKDAKYSKLDINKLLFLSLNKLFTCIQ